MDLTVRPVLAGDFARCAELLEGHLAYPAATRAALPRVWRRWLDDEAMVSAVLEDQAADGGAARIGFAISVFIDDAWLEQALRANEPFLSARTVSAELEHTPSPVLRPAAIGRSNAGAGLHLLNVHYCEAPGLSGDAAMRFRFRMMQAFLEIFRGYRIQNVVQEFWDEIDTEFIVNGWGSVAGDYSDYFSARGEALPPHGQRPYLVALSRTDAAERPGDPMAAVFANTPARFRLTRSQKKLLREALRGLTDAELAGELSVAAGTIKSHWRSIYNHVARTAPDLLPNTSRDDGSAPIRGQEKRRRLLEYLRRHPEELCPGINEGRVG